MGKFFYRKSHYIFGAILLIVFISWGGSWFWQKSAVEARLQSHLSALGAQEPYDYELHGFPNRYDFRFENLTIELGPNLTLELAAFEIDTLAYNDELEIWALGAPLVVNTPAHSLKVGAEHFRASLQYQNGKAEELVLEGQNAEITVDDQVKSYDRLVMGFGTEREPKFALRLTDDGKVTERTAEGLDDLISDYLQ